MNRIQEFFSRIWFFRRNRKREDIIEKLERGLRKKREKQVALKNEILKKMRNYLRYDARSKYIPSEFKSEFEVRRIVEAKWGKRMKSLDLVLTKDMILEIR